MEVLFGNALFLCSQFYHSSHAPFPIQERLHTLTPSAALGHYHCSCFINTCCMMPHTAAPLNIQDHTENRDSNLLKLVWSKAMNSQMR